MGLLQTARKYHDLADRKFEVMAWKRIVGAMRDEFRATDKLTRTARKRGDLDYEISIDDTTDIDNRLSRLEVKWATYWEPEEEIDQKRKLARLNDAINRLPKRLARILRDTLAGVPQADTAERLGVSGARASQLVKLATSKVIEYLEPREKP
jgi:RNA polymerase sigma factor (sigma-70 family)